MGHYPNQTWASTRLQRMRWALAYCVQGNPCGPAKRQREGGLRRADLPETIRHLDIPPPRAPIPGQQKAEKEWLPLALLSPPARLLPYSVCPAETASLTDRSLPPRLLPRISLLSLPVVGFRGGKPSGSVQPRTGDEEDTGSSYRDPTAALPAQHRSDSPGPAQDDGVPAPAPPEAVHARPAPHVPPAP